MTFTPGGYKKIGTRDVDPPPPLKKKKKQDREFCIENFKEMYIAFVSKKSGLETFVSNIGSLAYKTEGI